MSPLPPGSLSQGRSLILWFLRGREGTCGLRITLDGWVPRWIYRFFVEMILESERGVVHFILACQFVLFSQTKRVSEEVGFFTVGVRKSTCPH